MHPSTHVKLREWGNLRPSVTSVTLAERNMHTCGDHVTKSPKKVTHLNIPAWSMAPLMATEPSLVAGSAARLPLKEPIGVRTALTMTTS